MVPYLVNHLNSDRVFLSLWRLPAYYRRPTAFEVDAVVGGQVLLRLLDCHVRFVVAGYEGGEGDENLNHEVE